MVDIPLTPCAAEVLKAEPRLSEEELKQLSKIVNRARRKLKATNNIDLAESQINALLEQEGERLRLAAAINRKNAALNIIARDRLANKINKYVSAGMLPKRAILTVLEGGTGKYVTYRESVYATRLAIESRWLGGMEADLLEVPGAIKLLKNAEFNNDVLREMMEIREGGNPGVTKNKDAQNVAKIFARYAEVARQDLNKLGANIGKLGGWTPHSYDVPKLLKSNADDFAANVFSHLDKEKSFPELTDEEIIDVLKDIYLNIVTGRDNKYAAKRTGKFSGPANLGKSLSRNRTLHYKTADDWLAVNALYGSGDLNTAMFEYLGHAARMASEMQWLGPNPKAMLESFLDEMQEKIKFNDKLTPEQKNKQISQLNLETGAIANAFAETQGLTAVPAREGITMARIGSGIRAQQSMSKLGGAVLPALFGDLVTAASTLRYHGVPLFKAYHDATVNMIRSVGKGVPAEEKRIAYLLGEGFDGMNQQILAMAHATDTMPGVTSKLLEKYFKWSGLSWATDSARAGLARMISARMGLNSKKGWGALDDQYKFVLGQHGIDAARWEVIRQGKFKAENGNTYVTPDVIPELPDELFHQFVEGKITPSKVAREKLNLELQLRAFFADEVNFGVLEADEASRRIWLRGTRPGTIEGEFARMVAQFKMWPTAFTQRVLSRAAYGQRNGLFSPEGLWNVGHLIFGMTVAGYLAQTAKDYAKGYDRKKWINQNGTVNLDTLGSSFVSGGAAGIYTDYLFGEANRYGGIINSIAGPGLSSLGEAIDILNTTRQAVFDEDAELTRQSVKASKALNWAVNNFPGANIVYIRPALDYLFLDAAREAASPGFLQRQAEKRRQDYNQTLWRDRTIQSGTR